MGELNQRYTGLASLVIGICAAGRVLEEGLEPQSTLEQRKLCSKGDDLVMGDFCLGCTTPTLMPFKKHFLFTTLSYHLLSSFCTCALLPQASWEAQHQFMQTGNNLHYC